MLYHTRGNMGKNASSEKEEQQRERPPIYIAFEWHMHQPIYRPYETVTETMNGGKKSNSIKGTLPDGKDAPDLGEIFYSRSGPYTTWVADAIESGKDAGLADLGASMSFSGSLIENLNALEEADPNGPFKDWADRFIEARHWETSEGNPRLDIVGFGYHHPLMGLIEYDDIRRSVQDHKRIVTETFGDDVAYSKGIFPPENAFSERMIPALVDEGFEWALIDNVHLERACENYPYTTGSNLKPPNPADQQNPDPDDWVQLNGLWSPGKVSGGFAHRPHWVEYTDANGRTSQMIGVFADRYLGTEDARGGFGALNYEHVMSQLEKFNTDPDHPLLIVLPHDGDNYGGGSDSYYHQNFQRFVQWLQANPDRFVCTTIQDYLDKFPVADDDVVHVEPGSWSGADNGDPEFKKWNGDPVNGYSPDRNSWAVIVAAKNRVRTAEAIDPNAPETKEAWRFLDVGQTSCYWYWDGNTEWDSNPTLAANQAVEQADRIIGSGPDTVGPTLYLPQRDPYNPGGRGWGDRPEPEDVRIWTLGYDVSGIERVDLKYREVGEQDWQSMPMAASPMPAPKTDPQPFYRGEEYGAELTGLHDVTLEYCVEAQDTLGNISQTDVQQVYIE